MENNKLGNHFDIKNPYAMILLRIKELLPKGREKR